ncbi:MAG: hypothetical protein ACLR56_09780 [Oscillospiraceae bacterium]
MGSELCRQIASTSRSVLLFSMFMRIMLMIFKTSLKGNTRSWIS